MKTKLAAYSVVAKAMLFAPTAIGAIQIVDLNPDVVTSPSGITDFVLDLNNDGVGDFDFYWGSYLYYYSYKGTSYYVPYIGVYGFKTMGTSSYAANPLNRMIGGNAVGFGVPYALYSGVEIGPSGTSGGAGWIGAGTSTWIQSVAETWAWPRGANKWATVGYKGVTERYLGLKFEISGNVHYGWVWATSCGKQKKAADIKFTILKYAYQDVAGAPIITGQTVAVGVDKRGLEHVNIYGYGNSVHVTGIKEGSIRIYNTLGKKVHHTNLNAGKNTISLEKGIYLVRVNSGGKQTTKKVSLY
ncbi:MAG: T9SS type A sorting domain-containing protein [Bacteroidetes bacterium]|nr:T9SS type A sorting domain-containing protein [Bacteroidota bacterium]